MRRLIALINCLLVIDGAQGLASRFLIEALTVVSGVGSEGDSSTSPNGRFAATRSSASRTFLSPRFLLGSANLGSSTSVVSPDALVGQVHHDCILQQLPSFTLVKFTEVDSYFFYFAATRVLDCNFNNVFAHDSLDSAAFSILFQS